MGKAFSRSCGSLLSCGDFFFLFFFPPPKGMVCGGRGQRNNFLCWLKIKSTGLLTRRPSCFQNRMLPHPQHTDTTSFPFCEQSMGRVQAHIFIRSGRTSKGVIKYVKYAGNIQAIPIWPWEGGRKDWESNKVCLFFNLDDTFYIIKKDNYF